VFLWPRTGNTVLDFLFFLFCFPSQRGLCSVVELRTLSEDGRADELSQRSDGLHGTLHRTVRVLRDGSAAVDLFRYCRDFPLFVTGRNGKGALTLLLPLGSI